MRGTEKANVTPTEVNLTSWLQIPLLSMRTLEWLSQPTLSQPKNSISQRPLPNPAEGELNENKTYVWLNTAGLSSYSGPAKCRDCDRKISALATFTAPGTDDTCVHGCRAHSGFTFRNLFPREIEHR